MTTARIDPDRPISYWPRLYSAPAAAEVSRTERQAAAIAALDPVLEEISCPPLIRQLLRLGCEWCGGTGGQGDGRWCPICNPDGTG